MAQGGVLENQFVPGQKHCTQLSGRCHDESVSRVPVEDAGKPGTANTNGRRERHQGQPRQAEGVLHPFRNDSSPACSMSCTASGLTPARPSTSHTQTWVPRRTDLSTLRGPCFARRAHDIPFLHNMPRKKPIQAPRFLLLQWDEPSHRFAAFCDDDDLMSPAHLVYQRKTAGFELPRWYHSPITFRDHGRHMTMVSFSHSFPSTPSLTRCWPRFSPDTLRSRLRTRAARRA